MSGFRVAIDYGTSTTVAFLHWPDGKIRPLLFGDSPLLPSAVYLEDDDRPLTGRDAVRSARFDPARFEANPKRRIDDGELLLGDRVIAVPDLIAATLRRVWREAARIAGEVPGQVTLTHPAAWGERRRGALLRGADLAGLPSPVLVAEPVAAATYFTVVLGRQVPPGACVVVYDLGAGTFDVSVMRRDANGFTAVATAGLADLGGLDLDALVVDLLRGAGRPADAPAWDALRAPAGLTERRAFRELWDAAREAKEALSLRATTPVPVPGIADPQHLTRGEFEAAAVPMLTQTVTVMVEAVRAAGVRPADVAGVFLVGGATRMPLVASLLHRATGIAPTVMEQPELVVAEGALHVDAPVSTPPAPPPSAPAAPPAAAAAFPMPTGRGAPEPVPAAPPFGGGPVGAEPPVDGAPQRPRRRGLLAGAGVLALALVMLSGYLVWHGQRKTVERPGAGAEAPSGQRSTAVDALGQPAVSVVSGGASPSATSAAKPSGKATSGPAVSPTPRFTGPITVTAALVKTRVSYTGACPPPGQTPILLYADITVNGPTEVTWSWHQDPSWDPDAPTTYKLSFTAAGTKRTSAFYGGWSEGATISYWVELQVSAPKQLTSERVTWSTACT
jgi:hypothetical protein